MYRIVSGCRSPISSTRLYRFHAVVGPGIAAGDCAKVRECADVEEAIADRRAFVRRSRVLGCGRPQYRTGSGMRILGKHGEDTGWIETAHDASLAMRSFQRRLFQQQIGVSMAHARDREGLVDALRPREYPFRRNRRPLLPVNPVITVGAHDP